MEAATHTRWIVGDDEDSDSFLVGPASFDRVVTQPVVTLHDLATASRIVACWNACEGLSTELLENITTVGDTLLDRFEQREKTERELKAQRDELLAAVVAVRHWDVSNLALDVPVEIRIQMQAAIEACEPKPAVKHLPSDDTEGGGV